MIAVLAGRRGGHGSSRCFVRPPLLRIARLLESRNPALGSKLVNILQLDADSRSESAAPLTRELARRAVADAGQCARSSRAAAACPRTDASPPGAACRSGGGAVSIAVSIFGGHHVRNEWLRFLDPYGDHPPFSLTHLEILKPVPGDKVLYGGDRTVEVRATRASAAGACF